ncbi:hypothetical protein WJX73_000115 [Symbiochloris irregularis]|uniref:Uncharacterized protein n=1 Tax=Symbiochloris irregularis TaxID=706552 RepID=A0AAW1NVU8_9CHLO
MENTTSLHDELLRDLQETGMYDMATEMGIVQDGEITDVRLHERRTTNATGLSTAQLSMPVEAPGDEADQLQGQELIAAADYAADTAARAAEQVHARMNGGRSLNGQCTPPKRKKRGQGGGAGGLEGPGGSRAGSKGLRHFSMKVSGSPKQYDEKNIRRRVYDALNVLMAMDIIAKHKKEILWRGLPHNQTTAMERLRGERARLAAHITKQRAYILELQKQQAAYRGLLQRNREQPLHLMQASQHAAKPTALPLPFVLIQVDPDAVVEIQISDDSKVAHFDFQGTPFRMIGDEEAVQGRMPPHATGDQVPLAHNGRQLFPGSQPYAGAPDSRQPQQAGMGSHPFVFHGTSNGHEGAKGSAPSAAAATPRPPLSSHHLPLNGFGNSLMQAQQMGNLPWGRPPAPGAEAPAWAHPTASWPANLPAAGGNDQIMHELLQSMQRRDQRPEQQSSTVKQEGPFTLAHAVGAASLPHQWSHA